MLYNLRCYIAIHHNNFASMRTTPPEYLQFQMPLRRTRIVLGIFCLLGVSVLSRVLYLQTSKAEFLEAQGEARYVRTVQLPFLRGQIMDRNGLPLAVSLFDYTVSANPEHVALTPSELARLSGILRIPAPKLDAKLASDKRLVVLKRRLEPALAEQIRDMKIPGIILNQELHRSYSQDAAFSQVVGFTDVADKGQEGAELAFEDLLNGVAGQKKIIKDLKGHTVAEPTDIVVPEHGKDLTLALDARIQNVVHEELLKVHEKFKSKSAAAVMVDVQTGEILAMSSVPAYDPSSTAPQDKNLVKNRSVTDLFEPGSTLKPFTMAAAVDNKRIKFNTVVETGNGRITVGKHTITDTHPAGTIQAWEVIQKSSNVGMTKITLAMPAEEVEAVLRGSGFGAKPGLGLSGEARGMLRPAKTWKPIEQATISFGNGVSVSMLQLVHGYSVFARDGTILPLSLTKLDKPGEPRRVVSRETADVMRRMLMSVLDDGGTAKAARVPGYTVAGKTGTAHKVVGRTYGRSYVGTFVGFTPASNPRFVLGVMVDEPKGAHFGGIVAAPTFSAIAEKTLRILNVPKDAPIPPPAPNAKNPSAVAKKPTVVVED